MQVKENARTDYVWVEVELPPAGIACLDVGGVDSFRSIIRSDLDLTLQVTDVNEIYVCALRPVVWTV